MPSVIFALLAAAAFAATLTTSASAAFVSPRDRFIDTNPAATSVAYRGVRRTTVRGRGGVYHSRTVVRGGRYYGPRRAYASRRVYARGGRYYGPSRVYASRRVYARGGRYYGPSRVYAGRRVYRSAYRGRGRVYTSRTVRARGRRF